MPLTKAVVLDPTLQIEIKEIEVNEPFTDDDVRIAVKRVGICGSDTHYVKHGELGPFKVKEPMILGHEASGIVVEVGANVTHLKVGDRVCMEPGVADPCSRESRRGQYNLCRQVRFWATPPADYATNIKNDPAWKAGHGCLRPEVVHPGPYTFKLPDNVSLDEGALVEPLSVGVHACSKAEIKPGDRICVVGAGPIGMLASLAALSSGAAKVIISDISNEKLRVAESLSEGKIFGVNPLSENLEQRVKDMTDGWGADIVLECSGNEIAAAAIPKIAAPGGSAVFVGCPPKPVQMNIGDMQVKELRTQSIFRYAHVYPRAIAMLETGSINLNGVITNRYHFNESIEAFTFMVDPPATTIKTMIHFDD